MSNSSLSLRRAAHGAPHRPALEPKEARLKAGGLALLREIREFVKAVGSTSIRDEMLECAEQVATTQPDLARRLRRAARSCWY